MYQYRGKHLSLLLKRLERRTGKRLQKIALSATIADMDAIARFFRFEPDAVRMTEDVHKEIVPHLVHLKEEVGELIALFDDLYRSFAYRKILVFANSRSACDRLFAALDRQGRFQGACGLHYSNLTARARRTVESRFRRNPHALCIATSTLELGIDVGDVDAVVLYEPPDSVSAFLQRIGRANRRQDKTLFWGICRGPKAGEQLARFLGLLSLARQGLVEKPLPRKMISVLGQQTVSCIYEKGRVSLTAMKNLFPKEEQFLNDIFVTMEKRGWLKKGPVENLFQGGWRYRNCLFEYEIWSNFPETEEDYALEVSQKILADIPRGVVAQLQQGDRVNLAGKRLQIVEIIHAKGAGRVVALPSTDQESKEIFLLGPGMQVSWEVAQSVRDILKSPDTLENAQQGLFSRTRALLQREREKVDHVAVLENGIQVIINQNGFYRYLTYLGSVGNLILRWTVQRALEAAREEDIQVDSDAVGVDCSHWIDFMKLSLPANREDLALWAGRNLGMLLAAFPLNRFCNTLPKKLLIQEMADALFDARVADTFARYRRESSGIVSGTPQFPERDPNQERGESPMLMNLPARGNPLLEDEKNRMAPISTFPVDSESHSNRPLTGSILAGYFRHRQCERFLRLHFVPPHLQPDTPHPEEENGTIDRLAEGVAFEETVVNHLKRTGAHVVNILDRDSKGKIRSSKHRRRETVAELEKLCHIVDRGDPPPLYLRGGVLFEPALFSDVAAMGVPDLIRISGEEGKVILEVGEIKASLFPRFHHKWQAAFYAFLLERSIKDGGITGPASVSETGFLLLPSFKREADSPVEEHPFDLPPYLAAFPALIRTLEDILSANTGKAGFHLKNHCTNCPWFACCYGEALRKADIQFLPHLSPGELDLFKKMNLNTIEEAENRLSRPQQEGPAADPRGKNTLQPRITALLTNRILCTKRTTRLFPANIGTSIIFLAGEERPSSPSTTLGLLTVNESRRESISRVWETGMNGGEEESTWDDFEKTFLTIWRQAVGNGKDPHIFSFGNRAKWLLLQWASHMGTAETYELFDEIAAIRWTDLKQVLKTHFALPAPGETTLSSLGHILGLSPALKSPATLFHRDNPANALEDELLCCESIRKWVMVHLLSARQQEDWETEAKEKDPSRPYVRFVEEEQRLRREDVFSLQEVSLKERVERFRAMGPLRFTGRELDHEGKFRYTLSMEEDRGPSKFREGDFLKLVPRGVRDLQSGFDVILNRYDRRAQTVFVSSRQGSLALNRRFGYSLEEDAADWNTPKLLHTLKTAMGKGGHPLLQALRGRHCFTRDESALSWIRQWLAEYGAATGLNKRQRQAMELPFTFSTGLIDGPPGTGKTHLLGWMLIALVLHARASGKPISIAVSALTHQAIDNALVKTAQLLNRFPIKGFPARLIKWGAPEEPDDENGPFKVETCNDPETVFSARELILGATGYGLYRLFDSRNGHFPRYFDWIVLDEASQILVPQAALSLVYGKGRAIFSGDIKQLPPIILGRRSMEDTNLPPLEEDAANVEKSIMEILSRNSIPEQRVRLDVTYRMNREICRFPSDIWYDGTLKSAPEIARSRLAIQGELGHDDVDRLIDPEKPVTLGILDHRGSHQECEPEAHVISRIAFRMISHFGIQPDRIAIISPHRTQNNVLRARLSDLLGADGDALPLIDTVERVQGAERDVIIFGFTTSDRDHVMSEFLNNPNRFNVVITRAKKKLIVIGSKIFFSSIPHTEKGLRDNACFKRFYAHCEKERSLFFL